MKMPLEWLGREAELRMIDEHVQQTAPVALWAQMSALTGGAEPVATLVEVRTGEGETEWRALWLTDSLLAFGTVQKAKEGWNAHSQASGSHQPDTTAGWARPLRSVVGIDCANAQIRRERDYSEAGGAWAWSSSARIVTADSSVELPLFGAASSEAAELKAQEFISVLVQRL